MALILIVDDDEQLCSALCQQLEAAGHQCRCEFDGERAFEFLQNNPVELLILDVMLPRVSGFELCRRVHVDPKLYCMPILFLSAMSSPEEIAHGLAQGADDYLAKPFRPDALLSRVDRLLQTSARGGLVDPLTELAGPKAVKLEVQRAISEKRSFAMVYIELLNLGEFGQLADAEGRGKAIRHLARGLSLYGKELEPENFFASHMGGGHFVCLIPPRHAEKYGQQVCEIWRRHLPRFYKSIGLEKAFHQSGSDKGTETPLLDVLACVTVRNSRNRLDYAQLLEVMNHIRQRALLEGRSGLVMDRRV